MKKLIPILLMAVMALGVNYLWAQEASVSTLTANSGTATSNNVPIQAQHNYAYSTTQFNIDDEALDPARGGYITQMAFSSPSTFVFLGEEYESETLYHATSFNHSETEMPTSYDIFGSSDFSPMTTISYLSDTPPTFNDDPLVYYTHTVNIGTLSSSTIPILGSWNNEYVVTQFILQDDMIENIRGGDITQLKFHLATEQNTQLEGHYDIYVTETDENWFYVHQGEATPLNRWSFYAYTEDDKVCTVESIDIEDYTWTIPFDQPKHFEGWVNDVPSSLMVTILHTPGATNKTLSFLGQEDDQYHTVSVFNRDMNGMPDYYNEYGVIQWAPMTTITYCNPLHQPSFTVRYDANGAMNGEVPAEPTNYDSGSEITIADNTGGLETGGHAFTGWNTRADGHGTHYDAGSHMVVNDNTVLYAELKRSWTVSYLANGVAGTVPVDTLSPYIEGSTITVLAPDGLTNPGRRFTGWQWFETGIGNHIAQPGEQILINQDIIFTAQWVNEFTVTYHANGATEGTAPVDPNKYLLREIATILGQGDLVKTDCRFDGWRMNSGNGQIVREGDQITMMGNVTLFANWVNTYPVLYFANDATGGTVPVDENRYALYEQAVVMDNVGGLYKDGCVFTGWRTHPSLGYGSHYNVGQTIYINNGMVSLYAEFTPLYTLTYDANGADGGTAPVDPNSPYLQNAIANVLGNTGDLACEGYSWYGWNRNQSGTNTHYGEDDPLTMTGNITLYADWRYRITYDANGANSGTVPEDPTWYRRSDYSYTSANIGELAKENCYFNGWNTEPDGSGTHYVANQSINPRKNTTLYAEWTPVISSMEEVQAITNTNPYNTYEINVDGWQVTFSHTYYKYNNYSTVYLATAYFTDGQGHGIMAFDNSRQDLGFVAGDRLSGIVSCNIARDSRGYNVIRNLFSSSTGLTITNDGSTATPFNTTISDIGMAQHGALVSLQNVSSHQEGMYKFFDETDGNNSIGCFYANNSPFANHTPNTMYGQLFDRVTGIVLYQNINNSEQFVIYPLSSDDVVAHPYSITLNQTEHGIITCEQTGAIGNENVYISNVAEEGYELYALNVYKADDPSETVCVNQGNSYYFYMPTYDVVVEPVFGEAKHNINCDNRRYFDFTDLNGRSITRAATGEWVKITTYYYNDNSSYAGPEAFSINGGDVAYYLSPEASTPTQFAFCTTEYYFQMPDGDAYITSTINPYLSFFYMWDYTWNGLLESQRRCYYAPVGVPVTLPQNTYEGYTFERYYLNSSNYPYEEMNECLSDDGRTFTIPYGNIVTVYAFYNGIDVTKYAIDNQATGPVDHRVNINDLNFSPDEAPAGTSINVNINIEEATDGSVVLPAVITITPDDASIEPTTFYIAPKEFDPNESFHYTMPASDVTITADTGTYYKLYQVNISGSFNLQSLYYILDKTIYATANEQIRIDDYLVEDYGTFYEYEILDLNGNPRSDLLVDGILTMPAEPIIAVYHYFNLEYTYNVSIDPEISDYITITSTLPAARGTRVTFTTSDGLSFYPGYELGVADNWGDPLPMSPAYSPDIHEYYFYITEDVTIAPVEIPRHWVDFYDSYGDDPSDRETSINEDWHEYQRGSVINITPREHYGFTFVEYQAVKYNDNTGEYDDITSQVLSGNATDGYTLTMPDYNIILWGRYTPTPGFRYKITYVKWLPAYDIEMDVPVVEYAEAGETVTFSFPDDYSYANFLQDYDITQGWYSVDYENNTFTMPLGDVTVRGFYELTNPVVLVRVNGEMQVVVPTEEEGAKTMAENNGIDLTPYVPTEAPAPGFEFYKWYKNVNGSNYIYYNNSWMPDYCFDDTYTPNMFEDDETLTIIDAVFCQNAGMHYQYITEYPENGDTVCLFGVRDILDENGNCIESMPVGLDANGNSVSMENAFDDFGCLSDSWSDGHDNHNLSDILWIAEGNSEDGYTFRHANQNKFVSVTGTGQVVTTDGAENAAIFQIDFDDVYGYVEAIRTSDDKYLGVDENGNFTVYDEFQETGYVDLYKSQPFRKYFTTSIQAESDGDYINDFQGVHIIEGEVYANYLDNYEYNGLIVIKDGGVLNVQEIFNEDPYAIIIEDGGQLVHEYSNMKATVKKHVTGYGNRSADWQLIALPLYNNDENPLNYPIDDFTVGDYDLYAYDEPTRYWISPKAGSDETPLTVLDACRGYLYANADDLDLSFSGQMASPNNYPHTELSCEGEGTLNGFNLVGNPYTYNIKPEDLGFARVINEDEYSFTNDVRTIYKLNGSNAIVAQGNDAIIKPCEGFFVKASVDDEVLQFNRMYRSAKAEPMAYLKVEVEQKSHGRRPQLDRAYLNFNGARNVEKLVLDKNATRLSLVSEGKDYAALSASNEGTMPLNFTAVNEGTYTLTVSAERTEATYLHLLDKLTGADIDLLESGSYTFTATPSDDAMRFEIVFKTK